MTVMAASDTDDGEHVLRTVTPLSDEHPNREMNVIGWLVFLGLLVVMAPLGIVIVLFWAVSKLLGP